MSITAQTEKVNTCIYLLRVSSDKSRLHQGFFSSRVNKLAYIQMVNKLSLYLKNSPGAPTVLYMRDISRTLHV